MTKSKNLTIETFRGLAILLVVIGHVIGSTPEGGMKIDFPSPLRYLYLWIDYIQMPLFTAIAGWVYALKPIGESPFGSFMGSKFKRLIIPMAVTATIYYLMQAFVPGTNKTTQLSEIWRIYLFPYTLYWYLQSLFLIFAVVAIAEKYLRQSFSSWLIMLGSGYLLYVLLITLVPYELPNPFSYKGALQQLPYFIIGIGIKRYANRLTERNPILYLLALVGLVLLQLRWSFPDAISSELYYSMLPLWMFPTLVLLLTMQFSFRPLVFFGAYAYTIYLLHGFGTAGGRIILSYVGIQNQLLVFLFASVIAVVGPIVADLILTKNRYSRFLFLGKPF